MFFVFAIYKKFKGGGGDRYKMHNINVGQSFCKFSQLKEIKR